MLLSVNGISKSFEDRAVLSDVSFDIEEGEVVGFLGPNGAGKTTIFNLLTNVYPPEKRQRSKSSLACLPPTPARCISTG